MPNTEDQTPPLARIRLIVTRNIRTRRPKGRRTQENHHILRSRPDEPRARTLQGGTTRYSCYPAIITRTNAGHTIFLLSPANLGGQRARLVFNPTAEFSLARQLRSPEGAALIDVFSFVSGLYFRGKATYAQAFCRPPPEVPEALVITPAEGLCLLHERVTLERLRRWADVEIDDRNTKFTLPLIRHASAMERAHGANSSFVLLGSIASNKYVRPLARIFGDHLHFPADFVGRGDMSRGALLLQAARSGRELAYLPVEGTSLHGPRAPRTSVR
jgi:hypothetical protein